MNVLKNTPGGMPDVHVAVVSSPNTVFGSICDDDFSSMMTTIAQEMVGP